MGMYTEIFVNVDMKKDTPIEIIATLEAIVDTRYRPDDLQRHPHNWNSLFSNISYSTPRTQCAHLSYDSIREHYSFIGKGDMKNYHSEIEKFFEWIAPHVRRFGNKKTFMGYSRYEEDDEPTLFYVEQLLEENK